MTLPAGFDGVSTASLALCHLMLVPISVVAILLLRRASAVSPGRAPAGVPA